MIAQPQSAESAAMTAAAMQAAAAASGLSGLKQHEGPGNHFYINLEIFALMLYSYIALSANCCPLVVI